MIVESMLDNWQLPDQCWVDTARCDTAHLMGGSSLMLVLGAQLWPRHLNSNDTLITMQTVC